MNRPYHIYELLGIEASRQAAIACYPWIGKGDSHSADAAAVKAMRDYLNEQPISARVVIGEGERDEAPMLFIGEQLGSGSKEMVIDIAVDPLEGTSLCADNIPNAITTIGLAQEGGLLNAPDVYMEKIATNGDYGLDLDLPIEENIRRIASGKNKKLGDLTVIILDRPRHEEAITKIRSTGAKVSLIKDGDICGVIDGIRINPSFDAYYGIGGAPEGVLACIAVKTLNGFFQGRLILKTDEHRQRAAKMGLSDPNKKYREYDLVKTNAILAMTGVTRGELLDEVLVYETHSVTHTMVFNTFDRSFKRYRFTKFK